MNDYFKSNDDELTFYKITEDGKIFELDIYSATWDNVTDYEEFSPKWESVTEDYVNSFRLFIYCEQSERYFKEHKKDVGINEYEYGENYDFYFTDSTYDMDVVAVDDKKRIYYCSPKIMLPRMRTIDKIPESWSKIELPLVMDYVEFQDSYFLTNMDLYFDEKRNIQAYNKDGQQFCLNLNTHEMNIVFNKTQIKDSWKKCYPSDSLFDDEDNELMLTQNEYKSLVRLHNYVEESKNYFHDNNINCVIGDELKYYINDFGRIFAQDENGTIFLCDCINKMQIIKEDIKNLYNISRFEVINQIEQYKNDQERISNGNLRITDLSLYTDKNNNICGIDENNKCYELSFETGELEQIEEIDKKIKWEKMVKRDAIYIQGILKNKLQKKS